MLLQWLFQESKSPQRLGRLLVTAVEAILAKETNENANQDPPAISTATILMTVVTVSTASVKYILNHLQQRDKNKIHLLMANVKASSAVPWVLQACITLLWIHSGRLREPKAALSRAEDGGLEVSADKDYSSCPSSCRLRVRGSLLLTLAYTQ